MLSLEQLRQNAVLPTDEWLKLRDTIITLVRERLVARQLFDIMPVPATTQEWGYDRVKTEFASSPLIAKGASFPRDSYDLERIRFPMFKIGDGFTIPREDYLSGTFRSLSVEMMTRRVAEKEDQFLLVGDADFASGQGVNNFAGQTQAAAGVWASATPSAIYDDVRKAVSKLEAQKFTGPYSGVFHISQIANLRKFDTTSQRTALELVTGSPGLLDQVLISFAQTAGTGVIMQTGPDIAQLALAEDLTVEEPFYAVSSQRWEGNVYERFVPVFYQYGSVASKSDAIATLTSI